jgi:hypothetical protein
MNISYGQESQYRIKGQLEDSFSYNIPYSAQVFLVKKKDTVAKCKSDNNGNFQLSANDSGVYQLYVNHPAYLPFVDSFIVIKDTVTSLGLIELNSKSKLLDEVVIHDNSTVRIKGDTTEFTADSFLIKQFSSAKELLTKIPGIQIDLNGHITYNGRSIDEVSLDGIPFLSMGPDRLLTLLRGKDLDKVQLFDIKSLQSRLTGIDDNSRNTGLNLTLKQEAKTGYYGKLAGGIGASKSTQWDNSGNVNSFNDTRRVMLFTDVNNTGGTSAIGENSFPQQSTAPQGKPQNFSGGAHYDTRFLKDKKLSMNFDYMFNQSSQDALSSSNTKNLIPGNEFTSRDSSHNKGSTQMHNLNIATSYQLSSASSVTLTLSSSLSIGTSSSQTQSGSYSSDGSFLNSSGTQSDSKLHSPNTLANLSYQKAFNKAGRTFNASFSGNLNKSETDIKQVSNSVFSNASLNENLRQNKNNDQSTSNYTMNLHYSEPLMKDLYLNLDFNTNANNSLSNNNTYDIYQDAGNLADSLNPLYSNRFKAHNIQTRFNTALQYHKKRLFISLNGNLSQLNWNQNDLTNNNTLDKKYFNLLPGATFRYNMNSRSVFSLDFRTQTTQPQLAQIQPTTNNNDPLHIMLGNPDLTQSYIYNLSLNYSNTKPSKNRYFNAYASFSFTQNAISLNQYYNADGKEISQYINTNGNLTSNIYANYNRKLSSKMQFVLGENASFSKNNSLLNNQENQTLEQHYRSNLSLIYAIDTLLNISYSLNFDYSISHSSLLENSVTHIWNALQNLDLTYSLPLNFSVTSRFNWSLRPKIGPDDQSSDIFLWNMSISKALGKSQALSVKLFVYDLLNQNKSNFIYYGPNIQSNRTTSTIGRYAMLGIVWNFTKRKHN